MYELTKADQVWNRACRILSPGGRPGDWGLHLLLNAHGLIMNGGVLHCVEVLDAPDELGDSRQAYRYFGFDRVAELLLRAQAVPATEASNVEAALDRDYGEIIPKDSTLARAFEAHYAKHPEAYDPID